VQKAPSTLIRLPSSPIGVDFVYDTSKGLGAGARGKVYAGGLLEGVHRGCFEFAVKVCSAKCQGLSVMLVHTLPASYVQYMMCSCVDQRLQSCPRQHPHEAALRLVQHCVAM